MKKGVIVFLFFSISNCFAQYNAVIEQKSQLSGYVDPMIGTGGHGHTFPGATVPFGMVQLSPDTRVDGSWDGCSGYHYSDSIIYGFSHTHLSGTGCSDYGDIMIMPMMGKGSFESKVYSSKFSHKSEKASPGFYKVKLDDDNIDVELTATTRVGLHKYTFNKNGDASVILDLQHRDKLLEGFIEVLNDSTIQGTRRSEAWAKDQVIYYRIMFSKPFSDKKIFSGDNYDLNGIFNFNVNKGESIFVKVAISTVSTDGAKKNMEAELPGWNFARTKKNAEAQWNKELGKIEVTSQDKDKLKVFYTALYHTMIQPNVNMDVDGMYRGRDNKIHKAEGFTYYSVFSLWDTFRAAHPLCTMIDQKRTSDFINTFLAQYEQGGRLPVWELAGNETDCMIGYHSVSVIADAMIKGIKGFDYEKAFEASQHSAMLDQQGLKAYKSKGFIEMGDDNESVSKTLEYAYDDWCIAQMAKVLKKDADYVYFMKRSQSWKNVFDPLTGFMRPKKNGGWLTPFDAREVNNNFTEGNSWQYTFFVPQDISGLIMMMGGKIKFEKKLDELFTAPSQTTGREQADISGLIGQYAQGNEPSHHMAYLYNYVDKPQKTQERIHQIMSTFYKPTTDGLIGNEDCGQMSAWYVLNALGFYAVIPGGGNFELGTPAFSKVKIHFENNKVLEISAPGLSASAFYVQSYLLDGAPLHHTFIDFSTLQKGGELAFQMSPSPSTDVFENTVSMPIYETETVLPVPVVNADSRVFEDSLMVTISSFPPRSRIFYSCCEKEGAEIFKPYVKPFSVSSTGIVSAYVENAKMKSDTVEASFFKRPNHWKVQLNSKYNAQYTAGGDLGLVDGLRGDINWRKGEWQGYQAQDFEAVIDLGKAQKITEFTAGFLQDSRSWILMPVKVEYYTSEDNMNFTLAGTVVNTVDPKDNETQTKEFKFSSKSLSARYVKIKAYNFGKLPEWHQGAGDDAFIFVDEVSVR